MTRPGLMLVAMIAVGLIARHAAAEDKKHPHPHLLHALHELREAHHELKEAKHDYGGHKEAALRDIHIAIEQVELCLKAHGGHEVPKGYGATVDDKKHKHHPHLHEALHELKEAHHELKEAPHNFGGHKEAALKAINAAEKQIEVILKHVK